MKNQKKRENKIDNKFKIDTTPAPDTPDADSPNASSQDDVSNDYYLPYTLINIKFAPILHHHQEEQKKERK